MSVLVDHRRKVDSQANELRTLHLRYHFVGSRKANIMVRESHGYCLVPLERNSAANTIHGVVIQGSAAITHPAMLGEL